MGSKTSKARSQNGTNLRERFVPADGCKFGVSVLITHQQNFDYEGLPTGKNSSLGFNARKNHLKLAKIFQR